jgi:hypothetical protein
LLYKLVVKVIYNSMSATKIFITINKAEGLLRRSIFNRPSPFAIVTVDGGQTHITPTIKSSINPIWNSKFALDVKKKSVIVVLVYDEKLKNKDDGFLGDIRFYVNSVLNLDTGTRVSQTMDLIGSLSTGNSPYGKLSFSIETVQGEILQNEYNKKALNMSNPCLSRNQQTDDNSGVYYFNQKTKEISYKPPGDIYGGLKKSPSERLFSSRASTKDISPLPNNWEMKFTSSRRPSSKGPESTNVSLKKSFSISYLGRSKKTDGLKSTNFNSLKSLFTKTQLSPEAMQEIRQLLNVTDSQQLNTNQLAIAQCLIEKKRVNNGFVLPNELPPFLLAALSTKTELNIQEDLNEFRIFFI